MNDKMIGIKELHQNLKTVSEEARQGQSFIVIKNSKPVFKIVPLGENTLPKYSLSDFKKIQFKVRDKNLSKKIDNIMY